MPRRSIISPTERDNLLSTPENQDELIRLYTLSEADLVVIRQHRGVSNRLGFAVLLCYLRFPGIALPANASPSEHLLQMVAAQLGVSPTSWTGYPREQTRREHLQELHKTFGFRPFDRHHYRLTVQKLTDVAMQTDKAIVLVTACVEHLRQQSVILPPIATIERACAEAITRANRRIYKVLTEGLTDAHHKSLDALLEIKPESKTTWLSWVRQSPLKPNSRTVLEHIERLRVLQAVGLPAGIDRLIHRNRLLKLAREGGPMTSGNLSKFEPQRRYATLVALVVENTATVTDEIMDLHERILARLFNLAKHRHREDFHASGKAINNKVRLYTRIGKALLKARQTGGDAFQAIESVLPWEDFAASVSEAEGLAQPESFDFLRYIGDNFLTLRRYSPALLETIKLRAAPAAEDVLDAIEVLRQMNRDGSRKVPTDAPVSFVRKRWKGLVFSRDGIDRRYYELCVLSELKNALHSCDIWVEGSRKFKDFEEYLLPPQKFVRMKTDNALALAIDTDGDRYLKDRLELLEQQLDTVNRLALANTLPDASITGTGLKVSPLEAAVPDGAQSLITKTAALLPRVKITELLLEVEEWTGFTRHFTHLKTGDTARDKNRLLTVILADGINLGLVKMAESCPGTSYAKLAWLQAWHIRDETYTAALAELVNAQYRQKFALLWGQGKTSSSDGQRFRAGGHAESTGHINPKYGSEPGRLFYTHISDQYAPYNGNIVNVGVRDSTFVLDGLLYHESDLRIEEHYTDTAGFTDHVFALMHMLGFRFAPRIRDLGETKLYIPNRDCSLEGLKPLVGGVINVRHIRTHRDDLLRLAASIKHGTVTASLMLRKLGGYPRQNGLAIALRELGRIERTLFILDWLQNVELRRRVHEGLNKGEARNALARAVFIHRLGEIRDHSFEQQRYRASGLNLLTAAIVLWNTVYLERAVTTLRNRGSPVDSALFKYLSPLGWEHINLTGDYVWRKKGIKNLKS